ncbi:MAG TPA: hypothetical protein VF128_02795 [Gemmatimonadaceae bacterium]
MSALNAVRLTCLMLVAISLAPQDALGAQDAQKAAVEAAEAEAAAAKAAADAEAAKKKEQKRLRDIEKNSETLRLGLSLGWRHNVSETASRFRDFGINPANNHVVLDTIDAGAFVLSGVISAFPWRNKSLTEPATAKKGEASPSGLLWRLGFIANVNLTEFSADNITTFNKGLEGGLGIVFKLSEEFAFGATVERMFGRRLRSFVTPGEALVDKKGDEVTSLSPTDNTYFRDDNMTGVSFKFVYYLK